MMDEWDEEETQPDELRALLADGLHALMFLTRLPVRWPSGLDLPPLAQSSRAFGLVGLVIGAAAGCVGFVASLLGLSSLVAACLAIGFGIIISGAMAEDGFADMADGFWGGQSLTRKLEIMRDSRIGAYGVLALGLSLILRVGLASMVIEQAGAFYLIFALAGAASLGRGLMVPMMAKLPPARADGLSASAGQPSTRIARQAMIFSAISGAVLFWLTGGIFATGLGLLLGFAAAEGISRLARHHIGGQTGDVCGALSLSVEMASLAGLAMVLGNM